MSSKYFLGYPAGDGAVTMSKTTLSIKELSAKIDADCH
jgi:hypothetical protein